MSYFANSRRLLRSHLGANADKVEEVYRSFEDWKKKGGKVNKRVGGPIKNLVQKKRKIEDMPKVSKKAKAAAVGAETALTTRSSIVLVHRNKKVHKGEKHKKVRVSKVFREKVEKALAKDHIKPQGSWRQFSYFAFADSAAYFPDGGQLCLCPGQRNPSNFFSNDAWGFVGNIQQYLHMISVLWSNKSDSQNGRLISDADTLGTEQSQLNIPIDGQLPNANTCAFVVKSHKEIYKWKNNGRRTLIIKAYLCRPKQPVAEVDPPTAAFLGPTTPANPDIGDPLSAWNNALSTANALGQNVNNITPSTYGASPLACPGVVKYYEIEEEKIVIEPGQTFEYVVHGPASQSVNVPDYYQNQYLFDCPKWAKIPIFVCHLDLVNGAVDSAGTTRTCGRKGWSASTLGEGFSCEREIHVKFTMPEQAIGPQNLSATGFKELQAPTRFSKFYHKVYTRVADGVVYRVDEENPVTVTGL